MMKHVFYMKKSIRGAISVFLILIFLATYMLSAVLVDGGRYRMAQAMAETALDTAAESVLSYYNQMLYDLYGIFAVDSASVSREKIAEVMERYVTQTLGAADIDYSGYSTMLSNFLLEGDWEAGEGTNYFNDYDIDVNITAGASVTLASTDYVEDQIIDYMKYRVPLSLAEGAGSFLSKLEAIVNIKDRIKASKEQIKLARDHKTLFERSEALMNELNLFNEKIIVYCNDPSVAYDSLENTVFAAKTLKKELDKENAVDLYAKFGKALDDKLIEIGNYQITDVPEDFEGGPAPTSAPEEEDEESGDGEEESGEGEGEESEEDETNEAEFERLKKYQKQEYEKAADTFFDSIQPMFDSAYKLWEEANTLRNRIEAINNEYNQYISELQGKMAANPDSNEYKTVFEPEIELAKGNCGEVLKNVDLLLSSRQFTNDIYKLGTGGDWSSFNTAIGGLLDHRLDGGSPASLKAALDAGAGGNWLEETSIQYFSTAQGDLQALMSQAGYFYQCHKVEINVKNVEEITAENKEKEETEKPADLKEADLQVPYTAAGSAGDGESYSLNGKVKTDDADKLLDAGLSLIDKISQLLEGVRDNIYVNEYIMTTFPNVVDDKKEPKNLTDLAKKRREYDATYAGVEYILAGNASSTANVVTVDAELLGVRTIFNTVAIFTDSAKRHQASALAAAISGPFAPIVSIALLIGWAVAESAMDVVRLKNGEEVELFKTGSEWKFSTGGAIEECISAIGEKAIEVIKDRLSTVQTALKEKTSEVVYDVYNGATNGVDNAANAIKGKVGEFSAYVGEISGQADLMSDMDDKLSDQVNTVSENVKDWTGDAKEKAIKVVNESVDRAFDTVSGEVKNKLNAVSQELAEELQKLIPVGKVVNTGGESAVKLSYTDYLQIFLLMMNQQKKVQRIQSLIQANMIHGGNSDFRMEKCAVAVWADMDCSIRYLFMGDPVFPQGVKRAGRLTFEVHSARAY